MKKNLCSVVVLAVAAVAQVVFAAQLPSPLICPRMGGESDLTWTQRCAAEEQLKAERDQQQSDEDRARRVAEAQRATAATAQQRAAIEKQPPLAAANNRLLGRWETAARPSSNDPFAQIAAMVEALHPLRGGSCRVRTGSLGGLRREWP